MHTSKHSKHLGSRLVTITFKHIHASKFGSQPNRKKYGESEVTFVCSTCNPWSIKAIEGISHPNGPSIGHICVNFFSLFAQLFWPNCPLTNDHGT